ncbi:MAG: IS91 family transposase, partial [Planctomycetes bacterium]|nr:IS91 family transposase [Planctomycetota bacterium]
MVFHPRVHFIVPAGGVSNDGSKWCGTPENFLFPEAVASKIYRQKFREALRDAGLEDDERQR